LFYLVLPSLDLRTRLIAHMRAAQVLTVFHYQPLHLSEMGRRFGGAPGQCPTTEMVADRLVRLPLYFQLQADEQAHVIDALTTSLPIQ
jgi:dTDP-4-amino-4,6-dideoxygalactose transaminase